MSKLRTRWILPLVLILAIGGSVSWYKWPNSASAAEAALSATVKQGDFHVTVTTTGELRARKFVQIQGPTTAQTVGIYQTKIASMSPEGTVVKEGDVIADLDRAPAATRLSDVTLSVQKAQADYTSAELDSALNLAQAREDVRSAEYEVEGKKLENDEAQFEAPALKRQAEIGYEKSQRALDQAKKSLETKTKQAEAKMASVGADLGHQQNQLKTIQDIISQFTIKAPSNGMLIYVREWNGKKKGVGSQWSAWDPTVATLPDLSQMESDTYINEVDVRRIAVGQTVEISLDADPSKRLQGTVTEIANVGEQRPNQDSKVFEVKVDVVKPDTTLRPGMTTSNAVQTALIPNALSIPIEAVTSEGAVSFVYARRGTHVVKQQIETGEMNDNEVVVRQGLAKGDQVLLAAPADKASITTTMLPGYKPPVAPTGSDTGKAVTLPAPPPPATAPAAASHKPPTP